MDANPLHRLTRKTLALGVFLLCLTPARGWAGEMMRQVQEELRKRNLYFGEVDGKSSEAVEKAMAKYQQIKGFAVSGRPDADTLHSLGLAAAGAVQSPLPVLPDGVVLKSDAPRELTEADRRLLNDLTVSDLPSPPDLSEVEPPAPLADVVKEAPPAVSESSRTPAGESGPSRAEVEAFLRKYLAACEGNDLNAEMAAYGSTVDYFDHGLRQEAFIRKDVLSYYRRWPKRHYELKELAVAESNPTEAVVRFRIGFRVSNGKATAVGQTENVFKMQRVGELWKFASMKEQRLRK